MGLGGLAEAGANRDGVGFLGRLQELVLAGGLAQGEADEFGADGEGVGEDRARGGDLDEAGAPAERT